MRESGFTLMELVVGMVLLSIVAVIIFSGVRGSIGGYNESKSQSDGMAQAAEIADRLGSDLRSARSIGRSGPVISPSDLQNAIDDDSDVTDMATGTPLDWRDVTEATATSMTFQADVIDEAGVAARPECVRWAVTTGSGWAVTREVRAYSVRCAGSGAVLERDELTQPNTATPAPTNLFTYVVSRSTSGDCTSTAMTGAPSAIDRNRIVSVRMAFSSLATQSKEASVADLSDEISIRSRTADDYQFAMRCSA